MATDAARGSGFKVFFSSKYKPDPSGFPTAHWQMYEDLGKKNCGIPFGAGSYRSGELHWKSAFNNRMMQHWMHAGRTDNLAQVREMAKTQNDDVLTDAATKQRVQDMWADRVVM